MEHSKLAKVFKALSNEQRLKLFKMIYQGFRTTKTESEDCSSSACCGGVEKAFTSACECMDLSRSTISHHFKELQNAGLITCTRQGQSFICEVNEEAVKAVQAFLE